MTLTDRPCSVADCDRPITRKGAKGMCPKHYKRWKLYGSTDLPERPPAICEVDCCDTPAKARKMCKVHYDRWLRLGTTELPTLADRLWDRVDRSGGPDACWEWSGYRTRRGYGQIGEGRTIHPTHRVAWEQTHQAKVLPGFVVRHDCDNPPCCNPSHLRLGTDADNVRDMIDRGRAWWFRPDADELVAKARRTWHARYGRQLEGSRYGGEA